MKCVPRAVAEPAGPLEADEFDLIAAIARRAARRADVVLGIGDDAALLMPPPGEQLAISTDTLVAGVHYPLTTLPEDIGWKALAVNLSDLAAMGAEARWVALALTRPEADSEWLHRFLDGFLTLAEAEGVALVGGDTTRGPESITVAALGSMPAGAALRRDGAQAGDSIWVTGTLGDAAAALAGYGGPELAQRLARPMPRLAAGYRLRGLAHAAIDISDGLLADLGHIVGASHVGAEIFLAQLPTSAALAACAEMHTRWPWQVAGGDDYELCFTAPAGADDEIIRRLAGVGGAMRIGVIRAGSGIRMLTADGDEYRLSCAGYRHFTPGR